MGPAQVKELEEKYFDSANLVLVLVGNVKGFRPSIQKEFPSAKLEEIRFDQVYLLAPNLTRGARAQPRPE